MKIKFLGTAPGFSQLGKQHSSLWIEKASSSVLMDCGEGTYQRILEYKLDPNLLDAIVISHFHPDHSSGIFMVIQNLYIMGRIKPLTIYVPERVNQFKQLLEFFYLFPERLSFPVNIVSIKQLHEKYDWINPIANNHLAYLQGFVQKKHLQNQLLSYSFEFIDNGKSLIYSSDIKKTSHLKRYWDCHYMILDGYHPSSYDIKEIAQYREKCKKSKIILTHGVGDALLVCYKQGLNKALELANDGKEIYI